MIDTPPSTGQDSTIPSLPDLALSIGHTIYSRRIYVASSWRNPRQPIVVEALRRCGHEVYDFRHPAPGNEGFKWSQIDPGWEHWSREQYLSALEHPSAQASFKLDFAGMRWADTCVLVLPSGQSAHLKAGYFVGAGKLLHILLAEEPEEPDLMYLLAASISRSIAELVTVLQYGGPS